MSENSCLPVVVFGARDFQELLMSLDHEESTKPNQEDHNVGFIFFKVRLSFPGKNACFEMLPPRVPRGRGVNGSPSEGGESPFCV